MSNTNMDSQPFQGISAEWLSIARKSLVNDTNHAVESSMWRAFAILRGIRGAIGISEASHELQSPKLCALLASTCVEDEVDVLQRIVSELLAHRARQIADEVSKGVGPDEARKRWQHREFRHASQSGDWWLEELEQPRRCQHLAQSISCLRAVLPGLWTGTKRTYMLGDTDWVELLKAVHGHWPLPNGKSGNDYSSMDVGRLAASTAMSLGLLATDSIVLSDASFEALKSQQAQPARKMWDRLGLRTAKAFAAFQQKVVEVAPDPGGMPEWGKNPILPGNIAVVLPGAWSNKNVTCCLWNQCGQGLSGHWRDPFRC
jgi:hypothetical protein